jgi:long-chain acyl-CoA synthetase
VSTQSPRPWVRLYSPGVDPDLTAPPESVLEMFLDTVRADPSSPALHYFGRTTTRAELEELSRRIAVVLRRGGVGAGDRVAISLQNTPLFVATLLATWGVGACVVPINPMLRPGELAPMLVDSGAVAMIAHPAMQEVIRDVRGSLEHPFTCYWSYPVELAGELPLPFPSDAQLASGERVLLEECEAVDSDDFEWTLPATTDRALVTYTSGTTGPSKGAISTHANLSYQAVSCAQWLECDNDTSVLTVAPLFHITGLGVHLALALAGGFPLVLTYRFEPRTVLGLIEKYKPTFAVGAITAFISMLDSGPTGGPGSGPGSGDTLGLLNVIYSGGAPVPAHVVNRFEHASGRYIHNIYGLTESSSAAIGVPLGARAPIHEPSGALSVGVPMGGTTVTIVDDDGRPLPAGEEGEIVIAGPQVCSGYWKKPEESANAFQADGIHTGDVGVMDEAGWIYIVDRKKDLVVVSGYKVWPRDVEDVLYRHPSVKEAAVVGKPDPYRGETLHAFVSLRQGATFDAAELRSWCREHLSAYKVPTEFFVVDEIPKTTTGKILRRSLR